VMYCKIFALIKNISRELFYSVIVRKIWNQRQKW